jgi:hypothetical protein
MEFQTTHDFIAHGEIIRRNISIPATIVGEYPKYSSGNVYCRVSIKNEDWLPEFGLPFDYQNPTELKGKTEEGKDIWTPSFQITEASRNFLHQPSEEDRFLLKGIATFFIEGDLSTFNVSKGETVCNVSITPTVLALSNDGHYLPNLDGTISWLGNERQGIRWNTRLGEAELLDTYEYIHEKVAFEKVLVRFQKYQIALKITSDPPTTSLLSLLVEVKDLLDEPLLVLSFLSRKLITWYNAQATFLSADHSTEPHRIAYARYQQALGYEPDTSTDSLQFNVPVNKQALKEGVFQILLQNYRNSSLKNTIRQTIQYLMLSHERGYFEAQLGLVYAALESLVDGLSKHHNLTYLMGNSKFSKLSKELEETIFDKLSQILGEVIQEKVTDEDIAKQMIGKLPELRRPPIRERLLKLIEKHNLNRLRFNADTVTTVEGIIKRRNTYIHTGTVDYDQHIDDLLLLQELIELWILSLLGCPESAINSLAFRKIVLP